MSGPPLAKPYHPPTFQERGVVVPFTTPLLDGARVRPEPRKGIELIVHNPAGGRGVYVMPWPGVTSLCRPSLHDRLLSKRVARLKQISPASVRNVAWTTAAEGLAGDHAKAAAERAALTDISDHLATHGQLLLAFVHQANVVPMVASVPLSANSPALKMTAQQTAAMISPHLGQSPHWALGALDAITGVMASIGLEADAENGRVPRLLRQVGRTRDDIAAWSLTQTSGDRVSYARFIVRAATEALSLASAMMREARALTGDIIGLLRLWSASPDALIRLGARPEWLLDGWEQISLIWTQAQDDPGKRAALIEIADRVPIMPREASEWIGIQSDLEPLFVPRQQIHLNEDWRTGTTVFDLIARNEQFRAAAA